ncbi:MAG: lamin tail domain-containing protein [Anaplasmataceae bacterium]|nr:lamin tail domain-containing protein [Anaplasmataceae bacterium]
MIFSNLFSKRGREVEDNLRKKNDLVFYGRIFGIFGVVSLGLMFGFFGGRVAQSAGFSVFSETQGVSLVSRLNFLDDAWNILWSSNKAAMEIDLPVQESELDQNGVGLADSLPKAKELANEIKRKVAASIASSSLAKPVIFPESLERIDCDFYSTSTSSYNVYFNEIAWMGMPSELASLGARQEWIEMKNNSSGGVSLAGWSVKDSSGKLQIQIHRGEITGEDYFVVERDHIGLNYSFKGQLTNNGMWIRLFDRGCLVVDEVDARNGWPAGKNGTKQTMERNETGSGWHDSKEAGGTLGEKNSIVSPQDSDNNSGGNGSSTDNGTSTEDGTDSPAEYRKLLITELQIAGNGNVNDEFVEIYNSNNEEIDLAGWYLQKATKSGDYSTFISKNLFEGRRITAKGYLVIANSSGVYSGAIMTSNSLADHNSLVLKNPRGEVSDKVGWGEAQDCEVLCAFSPSAGKSIQRKVVGGSFQDSEHNQNDFEIRDCPSPGAQNAYCNPPSNGGSNDLPPQTTSTTPSSTTPTSTTSTSTTPTDNPGGNASTTSTSTGKVVIVEVQISGGEGLTSNDYVKLYNMGAENVDVGDWRLRKRTQSGSESSIKVLPAGSVIVPGGSFMWANSVDGFSETIGANTSSTQTLAANNSVGLDNGERVLIDAVGWGEALVNPYAEGGVYPTNPEGGQVLKRKTSGSGYQDTDDNASDFVI